MEAHEAPAADRRAASWRGPRPASISRPKPSHSTSVALPPLPLASTVNRSPIRTPPAGMTTRRLRLCTPCKAASGGPSAFSSVITADARRRTGQLGNGGEPMVEELHRANPVGRFSGLAGDYAAHRPVYPEEAIDFVIARAGLGPSSLVVDVGAGTGISSRLFARRGLHVVGIEPNDEMRVQA